MKTPPLVYLSAGMPFRSDPARLLAPTGWGDRIYYSRDASFGGNDILVGTYSRGTPLAAGGTYAGTLGVDLPVTLPAGPGYLLVHVAEPVSLSGIFGVANLAEATTSNNNLTIPITVQATGPDLAVTAPT